jgi:hypothetical protein
MGRFGVRATLAQKTCETVAPPLRPGQTGARSLHTNMKTRTCRKCQQPKPWSEYAVDKASVDGVHRWCKQCVKAYNKQYRQTPEGRAICIWHDMLARAGNRNGKNKAYQNVELQMTRDQFLAWAVPTLQAWYQQHPGEVPSIDRIDPAGHYTLNNVRIIAWTLHRRLKKNSKIARDLERARQYYENIARAQSGQSRSHSYFPQAKPAPTQPKVMSLPTRPAPRQATSDWSKLDWY